MSRSSSTGSVSGNVSSTSSVFQVLIKISGLWISIKFLRKASAHRLKERGIPDRQRATRMELYSSSEILRP